MEIYFIRHGKTAGNIQKRYVGSTDEPLCEEGICELNARREVILRAFLVHDGCCKQSDMEVERKVEMLPEKVYVSPMLRCRQTAELLFPDAEQEVITNLREMDFGEFEYKNYGELVVDQRYQAFIDSGGQMDFPDAEPQKQFRERVQRALAECLKKRRAFMTNLKSDESEGPLVFVVHGGTIMAIMEKYARPHKDYFDWQVSAAHGYRCVLKFEGDSFYLEEVAES